MIAELPPTAEQDTNRSANESPILLTGISWKTYESLLDDYANLSAPRLTYDRGTLQIMSPLRRHEKTNRTLEILVEVLTEEWEIETENAGSTTFKRADLERGFEPDTAYYIQNANRVANFNEIDLSDGEPPPDLVIEIDITSPSIDRMPIFAAVGVPEVWRWVGEALALFVLDGTEYRRQEESHVLPPLSATSLTDLVRLRYTLGQRAWVRAVRTWARQNQPRSEK